MPNPYYSVAAPSPDGDLVVIDHKHYVVLWSLRAGREVLYLPAEPHSGVSFGRQGLDLILDSENSLTTWRLDRIRKELAAVDLDW